MPICHCLYCFCQGLVLPGEDFSSAVKRRLVEEALADLVVDEQKAAEMKPKLDKLLENGQEVKKDTELEQICCKHHMLKI